MRFILLILLACSSANAALILSVHEGDSITQGQTISNYVYQLNQRVNDPQIQYTNIGLSGDTIQGNDTATDTLNRLTQAANYFRSIVVLEMGINDIADNRTTQQVTTNFLTWILAIRAAHPTTKIVQMTIMGSVGIGWGSDRDVIRSNINDWISTTAPVDLVIDQAKDPLMWTNNPAYFTDGIHPNDIGYRIIASNVWYGMNGKGYFSYPIPRAMTGGKVTVGGRASTP